MRKVAFIVAILNAAAAVTHAQRNAIAVFVNEAADSARAATAYGAAYSYSFTPRFSTDVAISVNPDVVSCTGGILTPERCTRFDVRTYPVDVTGRFHFLNDTRWKPYLGAGVRYVAAPHLSLEQQQIAGGRYSDRADAEIVGGLDMLINRSFGASVEVDALFRNALDYDSALKVAARLSWRF